MSSKQLEFGAKLRALRGDASLEDTAQKLGISAFSLRSYEAGERIPRDEIKLRIADFYNVDIDIFLS